MPARAARRLPDERYLRVSEAPKERIDAWKEGASLCSASGLTIDALRQQAASQRWRLAALHRRAANANLDNSPALYRSAVSRYYYAIYHAMRAVVYLKHGGDDHQEHKDLPRFTPDDLPDSSTWQNALKSAGEHRNRADYDPYPRGESQWAGVAAELRSQTEQFLLISRRYLASRGCSL